MIIAMLCLITDKGPTLEFYAILSKIKNKNLKLIVLNAPNEFSHNITVKQYENYI